jgi:hypothetical protein
MMSLWYFAAFLTHSDTRSLIKPLSISTLIPAETRQHTVRLSFLPLEAEEILLNGIQLRMLGGCVEERLYPLERYLKDPKKLLPSGALKKQTDQERFGKGALEFISEKKKKVEEGSKTQSYSIPVKIIEAQPILELLETSLGSNQAMTLFEGER